MDTAVHPFVSFYEPLTLARDFGINDP